MTDTAERAADHADRRARDADRIVRWGVGLVLGVMLVMAALMLELRGEVGDVRRDVRAVLERLNPPPARPVETDGRGVITIPRVLPEDSPPLPTMSAPARQPTGAASPTHTDRYRPYDKAGAVLATGPAAREQWCPGLLSKWHPPPRTGPRRISDAARSVGGRGGRGGPGARRQGAHGCGRRPRRSAAAGRPGRLMRRPRCAQCGATFYGGAGGAGAVCGLCHLAGVDALGPARDLRSTTADDGHYLNDAK